MASSLIHALFLCLLPFLSRSDPTYYGYPSYYSHAPSSHGYRQPPAYSRRPYAPSYATHSSHSFFNHGVPSPSRVRAPHAHAQQGLAHAHAYQHAPRPVIARVDLVPGGESGVSGTLLLKQAGPGGPVLITGAIKGLSEGPHGFHVHMKGELGNGCKDAGGHFNPFMVRVIQSIGSASKSVLQTSE